MQVEVLPNGNLRMTLNTNADRDYVRRLLRDTERSPIDMEAEFIEQSLSGFTQVKPEDVGALTSAPLIQMENDVWGYMDYQVKSFLEELLAGNTVIWQKG